MTTSLFNTSKSVLKRTDELRRLVLLAEGLETADEELYNSVCRSVCVLLSSHLEGFVKDLNEAVVDDINQYIGAFSKFPDAIKRNFCLKIAHYEGVEQKDIEKRVSDLISFFSINSVPVDLKAFTYKENDNKNPSSNFINISLERLGIPNVLYSINSNWLLDVFERDSAKSYILSRKLRAMRSNLYSFPYREVAGDDKFLFRSSKVSSQTLWDTYISGLLTRRHSVAHGDTMENPTDWKELRDDVDKLEVLMHAVTFACASFLGAKLA